MVDFENTNKAASTYAKAYLPSARLLAVPALIRHLATPEFQEQLEIESVDMFENSVGQAFRWATLRAGPPVPGIEMLRLNQKLRLLIHIAILRLLGFSQGDAEKRLLESIKWHGPS